MPRLKTMELVKQVLKQLNVEVTEEELVRALQKQKKENKKIGEYSVPEDTTAVSIRLDVTVFQYLQDIVPELRVQSIRFSKK